MVIKYSQLQITTSEGISLHDVTPLVEQILGDSGINNGFVTVTSRHTTTALTINENENRLLEDVRNFFTCLVPPGDAYLHNDIHLRDCPPDEPENAHSHLVAMLLGSSEVVPVDEGQLVLGKYQSILLVELDGPRERSLAVQVVGN